MRIATGDESAFRDLFHSTLPWLTPFIRRIVKTEEATKEVVQETFIRIWVSRDKLPALHEPRAWITKVASNECFTYFHKIASQQKIIAILEGTNSVTDNVAEDNLEMLETLQLVRKAVADLPPRRRKIYQMSREEGLKTHEIADRLNCSHSYVKNTLTTALSYIRQSLMAAGKIIPLLIFLILNRLK
ncbi:RNA polymerase sigma factor [Chitinophaga niastensis]|nr:sigma-70 family RNA polymerase sigma factor [Chitinophaga niastensis]